MKLRKLVILGLGILLVAFIGCANNSQKKSFEVDEDFYAYYTKVSDSDTDYMGKYADIIINLGEDKKLEFTRKTGYLPRLKTSNGEYLVEDLYPDREKDPTFKYNYVRLLKNSPGEIIVHWRYYPHYQELEEKDDTNPTALEGLTGVVHEIYKIYPDGNVKREVKEASDTKYHEWINPDYKTTQTLQLTKNGIQHSKVDYAKLEDIKRKRIEGNPVKNISNMQPIFYCSFDEGMENREDRVMEKVNQSKSKIAGPTAIFKKGISGTAMAFDGYYTALEYPAESLNPDKEMTIQAWLALDAYPYNDAPIIHKSSGFGKQGFYLGVDAYGQLIMNLNGEKLKSEKKLPLWEWACVTVTVGDGRMELYINDQKVASKKYNAKLNTPDIPVMVGYNNEQERCTDYVRTPEENLTFYYGIQGLLDEVRVFEQKLDEKEVTELFTRLEPENKKSSLAKGVLPGNVGPSDEFGAFYKTTKFSDIWDSMFRLSDYADVVVKFDDNPGSVVYWHGTNFAANWISDNNRWMSDQSAEIWGPHGCSEHMADKQVRHSRIRIIENTPARVVVHWRYPSPDISYHFQDKKHWTDEYHTIYPDGYGIRKLYWNAGEETPGFEDVQYLTNPGEKALDVVHLNANIVANLNGEVQELTWEKPRFNPEITLDKASIRLNNSKSRFKNYVIYNGSEISTWGRHENSEYTDDPFAGPWNHWPVNLVPSDGRFAIVHDRVTHFALGASDAAVEYGSMVIYGLTDKSVETLIPLAKSWRYAPEISKIEGARDKGYDQTQKAYVLDAKSSNIKFKINGSEDEPLYNPCFVVKNWKSNAKASLKIDGKNIAEGSGFRQGLVRDTEGIQKLVVWVKKKATDTIDFEFDKK